MKSVWRNKKRFGLKATYRGSYGRKDGQRIFVLLSNQSDAQAVYESHEAAKKAGWEKLK